MEQAIRVFRKEDDSYAAAEIAGLPRAVFLTELMDRGVTVLKDPSTLAEEIEDLARAFGDEHFAKAARELREARI